MEELEGKGGIKWGSIKIHQFSAYWFPTMHSVPDMSSWNPQADGEERAEMLNRYMELVMRPWERDGAVQVSTAQAVPLCGSNLWAESFLTRGQGVHVYVERGVLDRRFNAEAWGGRRLGPIMNGKPVNEAGTQWVTPGISWKIGIWKL